MSNLNKTTHQISVQESFVNNIFDEATDRNAFIFNLFKLQYQQNTVYKAWCDALNKTSNNIDSITNIPFLPISFFKTHTVVNGAFEPQVIFESSGTTQTINSKHLVKDVSLYEQSFLKAFEHFYGDINDWCVLGLLPSYLERSGSSLVFMVEEFIKRSSIKESGFYLYDHEKLANILQQLKAKKQKTLLIGVTFGLLDFAEAFPMPLQHTIIMETGGMKGRRRELTRHEVHSQLKTAFNVDAIHSEYGMTELLSQAYSKGEGRFVCPPWMKVLVRDEEDPLLVKEYGQGILNVIDMANVYSCPFIATDDVGKVYEDGSFEVWGRLDNSDIRGCSLLVV